MRVLSALIACMTRCVSVYYLQLACMERVIYRIYLHFTRTWPHHICSDDASNICLICQHFVEIMLCFYFFYLKTVRMICVELLWEVKKNLCNFKAYLLQRKGCDKFASHCQPNLYLAEQHIG